jgi:DNA-binding CsgD family transcriptional regulator
MAHYQLGELHRLRGELAAAERAYRRAHDSGRDPQPGLALLRIAQSRVSEAAAAIAHVVDDADDAVRQTQLLPACVEIMLAAGRVDDARTAADELSRLAAGTDAALLHATAAHCEGAVLLAEGHARAALDPLRDAWQKWQELAAPYQAAQTRILIGMACRAIDDHDTASLECDAARRAFEELGAGPALARLEELVGPDDRSPAEQMVTEREVEVLREVAAGRTNREIAARLVISEKTVERHLSNIFTKLGVANRAGATAYAYDHHLV